MAKNYIDDLSEEAFKGMREKAAQGIWPSKAPLGYRNVPRADGNPLCGLDSAGRFELRADAEGDVAEAEWPVLQVDWRSARAYLAWLAERTGRPWRLPGELEWEKAARGVDGRWYPWGDFHDPSWSCTTDSHRGRRMPQVVDSYPVDVSPYGVRGMAGNVEDWCLDRFAPDPLLGDRVPVPALGDPDADDLRAVRGGSWNASARLSRCAVRLRSDPRRRMANLGFRGMWRLG